MKLIPIKYDHMPESESDSVGLYFVSDISPTEQKLSTGSFRAFTICTSSGKRDIFRTESSKIKKNDGPTTCTADHNVTVNGLSVQLVGLVFFKKWKRPQMAAHN